MCGAALSCVFTRACCWCVCVCVCVCSGPLEPSNGDKLRAYGLYKQITIGDCNVAQPYVYASRIFAARGPPPVHPPTRRPPPPPPRARRFKVVDRAKWGAWSELRGRTKESCKAEYVDFVVGMIRNVPAEMHDDATRAFLAKVDALTKPGALPWRWRGEGDPPACGGGGGKGGCPNAANRTRMRARSFAHFIAAQPR